MRNYKLYVGILSDNGLEALMECNSDDKFKHVETMKIRARFNGHRNCRVFVILDKEKKVPEIEKLENYELAATKICRLSGFAFL